MNYKSTIVTMFFDLSALMDPITTTRDLNFYLKNGRSLLELKNPMIIFCDMKTKPLIKQIRDECIGPNNITIYIEKNIIEYDYYKECWSIIDNNRKKYPSYKLDRNKRATSSYFLTMMFKIYAIYISYQRNDFNPTHYFWMDFGCNHIVKEVSTKSIQMLENPNPKVSVIYIHYRHNELKNMIEYCNGGICGIAGGVFSAEKSYIPRFYTQMLSIFYEQLSFGVGHSDEQILTYCYNRSPELFTINYGDYYSLITNYHYPTNDWLSIKKYFIDKTLTVGKINLAINAAKKVYETNEKKLLTLSKDDILYLQSIMNRYMPTDIYCFLISPKEISTVELKQIETMKEISECNVILITNTRLTDWIKKDNPLHEAYEYLSDFHKIDYLRAYFMHFYGGGYASFNSINRSWIDGFNEFNANQKALLNGYSESGAYDVSVPELKKYWRFLLGNSGYIVRPNTDLTKDCYNRVNKLLDLKLEKLKSTQSTPSTPYPIERNELMGTIFHTVQMDYISNILYSVPKPI
jgi:hypothetical protein